MTETPRSIGNYTITGIISRSASGAVYKATSPGGGEVCAIKSFPGRVMAPSLEHPYIIRVREVCSEGNASFVVMRHIEGESLEQRLKRSGRMSPKDALKIAGQIGAALDYAHQCGVVHGGLSAESVLIDAQGKAHVFGFGLPCARAGHAYMAPEQILEKPLDSRTDLFSFAVMVYECLSGVKPFTGADPTALRAAILKGQRADITEAAPGLALALEAEFDRALALRPEDRFASAAEMLAAFYAALAIPFYREEADPSVVAPAAAAPEQSAAAGEPEGDGVARLIFKVCAAACIVFGLLLVLYALQR